MRAVFVDQDAKRYGKRITAELRKSVHNLLHAMFMTDWRAQIWPAGMRLSWVTSALPVHLIQVFRFRIVGLKLVVADRPRRRDTAVMPHLVEVLFAKAKQGRAVELRISPDVIVRTRLKFLALGVQPFLGRMILLLQHGRPGVPVVLFSRNETAAFQDQNALAAGR